MDKIEENIFQKQQKTLNFNWPDDTLFNKWMEDYAQTSQLLLEEAEESDTNHDEVQIIDAPIKIEERKEEKLTKKLDMVMQTSDLMKELLVITMDMTVQSDDLEGEK